MNQFTNWMFTDLSSKQSLIQNYRFPNKGVAPNHSKTMTTMVTWGSPITRHLASDELRYGVHPVFVTHKGFHLVVTTHLPPLFLGLPCDKKGTGRWNPPTEGMKWLILSTCYLQQLLLSINVPLNDLRIYHDLPATFRRAISAETQGSWVAGIWREAVVTLAAGNPRSHHWQVNSMADPPR